MTIYETAFGLRDNPFCPTKPLRGMASPRLMSNLSSFPLPVHREPLLLNLYCPKVGGEEILKDFDSRMADAGYEPPEIGTQPLLTVILGPQGTGKTTFANVMTRRLLQCAVPAGSRWAIYDPWPNKEFNGKDAQIEAVVALQKQILDETKEPDYCCVLVDNLVAGAEQAALNLYGELSELRIVFVFLMTSDQVLLKKNWDNVRGGPTVYQASELKPEDAVNYVVHRVNYFRVQGAPIPVDQELFPFDPDDIRSALARQAFTETGQLRSIVTLRQLNNTLCRALAQARNVAKPGPILLARSFKEMTT